MKVKKVKNTVIFFIMLICISCSKYEDGPLFSLSSPKHRISREWKVEYAIHLTSGISHSADYNGWLLKLNKDGTFSYKTLYNQVESIRNGKWEFLGKNQLSLLYDENAGNVIAFYTVLRLTRNEMWLADQYEEIHFYSD